MSDTATDFYHQKTEAELRFLIEHPEYYEADLIASAKREQRRRGVQLAPLPAPIEANLDAPANLPRSEWSVGFLNLAMAAAVLLGLGYFYYTKYQGPAAQAVKQAQARPPKAPPRLIDVPTSAIPSYDGAVAATVVKQVARVPAAEKANPEHLRQFRSLCKRFWSAETQTEYLTNQAHNGKPSPMFAEQALVVRQTWRAWNQAAVYHFKFGPAMQADYDHMARAASSQQHILDLLPAKLTNREFLKDEEIVARENEVQDYLAKLLPASPVTGRPYRATLLKMRLK